MKKLLILFITISTFVFAQAQNELKARIEFEEAEKAFEAENYDSALQHVTEAEKLIGSWSPKTGFLKIESLYAVTDMGNFAAPSMQPLYEEVTQYMAYMNKQKPADVPAEKYKIVYDIEKKLKSMRLDERQSADFLKARKEHDAENYDVALPLYEKSAQKGNSWAMRNLALIYQVKKENEQAKEWYLKAIEKGNAIAAIDLAYIDKGNEKKWYEKAAQLGYPSGIGNLGWYAEIKENNVAKALEYYQQAANLGSAFANFKIGEFYKKSKGVSEDFKKAEQYYLNAANRGDSRGFEGVGSLYHNGGNGITQNYQTAIEWYLKAIEKNNSGAMLRIGWIYQHGQGNFAKDYLKAEQWYQKAANENKLYAFYLGDLYSLPDNKQPQKALENYEVAAEAGKYEAILQTANFYFEGKKGISKDYVKATKYYEKYYEEEKKNEAYIDNLIDIYNRGGYGIEKDKEKAKYWKDIRKNKN